MKVCLYARVSSEKQAEKDLSIPAQLKAMEEYARIHGHQVVGRYIDEAQSARTADRPQFQAMIAAAKQKDRPFDGILVWKLPGLLEAGKTRSSTSLCSGNEGSRSSPSLNAWTIPQPVVCWKAWSR